MFGKVCKLRESTSRKKVAKEILFGTFSGNAATRYGIQHEEVAKEQLEKVIGKKIKNSGLIVDYSLPFLAASPDGLVGNNALVEIKCPASAKGMNPEDGIISNKIKSCEIKNGQLYLKRNHNFYYQVQGQLHIACKLYCYFCIWTPVGLYTYLLCTYYRVRYSIIIIQFIFTGLMIEKIKRDDSFWKSKMENQLHLFYSESMLPELLNEI